MFGLGRFGKAVFLARSRELATIAGPMFVTQLCMIGIAFVDTVAAGRASAEDLAAVALGSNVFVTLFITLTGIMAALNPMIAQLFGARKMSDVGECVRQGLWFALFLGLAGMVAVWLLSVPLRHYFKLGDYVDSTFAQYLFYVSLGLPAIIMYRALSFYASSVSRPKMMTPIAIAAFLLNIPLNYIFVYGKLGAPAMGGAGCGVASAIVFWFLLLVLWLRLTHHQYFKPFALNARFSWPKWKVQREIWDLGAPTSVSYFVEVSLFTFIGLLIVPLGVLNVAAHQVALSVGAIAYVVPQSIGAATGIMVAQQVGRSNLIQARYVSGLGLTWGIVGAAINAILLFFFRYDVASAYTQNAYVLSLAGSLLLFSMVQQLFDGMQTIASEAIRGYKITKVIMLIHGAVFWGLGLGLGSLLGLYFGFGLYGFWSALVFSIMVAAVVLVWLLNFITKLPAQSLPGNHFSLKLRGKV